LKGNSGEAPSCFRPELNGFTCTADKYLAIRTLLQVAFNTLPLSSIFSVDTNLKVSIHIMTGHDDPER
jgi:hypothetical protein